MKNDFLHKWKSQIKRGTLSFIVLSEINGKELYGYEIIENIKERTGIEVAEGTLYPLMNRLKKETLLDSKWVEQKTGVPRKYYFLTKEGRIMLNHMHKYWSGLEKSLNSYQYEI